MLIFGTSIIGYWSCKATGTPFYGINAQTGQPLEMPFYDATDENINDAVALAKKVAWEYAYTDTGRRALLLEEIGYEIMNLGAQLIKTAMEETGLPEARLIGERARTVNQLHLFAKVVKEGSWIDARLDRAEPDRKPLPKPDLRSMLQPLGPVAVFGASNFPFAFSVAGGDTASALAAGCPVIFKAHPAHPATCELVAQAIVKCLRNLYFPEGIFSLVQGASHQVGQTLVTHPDIKAVAFTGSFKGGKALFDAVNNRPEPIPIYAEMGSTNPVFFLPQILEKNAAELAQGLVNSVTLGVGQFCTNPGVFIVPPEHPNFIETVGAAMENATGGHMLTSGIQEAYENGVSALKNRATCAASGQAGDRQAQPHLFKASIPQAIENKVLTEEVFGPVTVGLTATSWDEVYAFAESLSGHLTASIHGTEIDLSRFAKLFKILTTKVGRVIINGFPTGVEVSHAMVHGGPFPATTDIRSTSVGTAAIKRFARPICFQDVPSFLLPSELLDGNPDKIWRLEDGKWTNHSTYDGY